MHIPRAPVHRGTDRVPRLFQAVLREQGLQTFNAAFQQLGERLTAADGVPPASLAPFSTC